MPQPYFNNAAQKGKGKAEFWVELDASLVAGGPTSQTIQGPFYSNLSIPNDFWVYGINATWTSQAFAFKWGQQAAEYFWSGGGVNGMIDARAAFTTYSRTIFYTGGEIIIPAKSNGLEAYFFEYSGSANTVHLVFFGYLTP